MGFKLSTGSSQAPKSTVGKLGQSLFFAIFFVVGLVFLGLVGSVVVDGLRPVFWEKAPATILSSGVKKHDDSFRAEVRYAYRWKGRDYTSDVFSHIKVNYNHYDEANALLTAFPPGAKTTCRVNPGNPYEAVLEIGNLWFSLFVFLPLVFVGVGGGGIWWTWTSRGARTASTSLSESASLGWKSRLGAILFGGVFLIVGLAIFASFSLPMWQRGVGSLRWVSTPCTILSGWTDRAQCCVRITYRYTFEEREYQSDRYDASGDSPDNPPRSYRKDGNATCYVNPKKPYEAVLEPGLGWRSLFGLFPFPFIAAGLFVMVKGGAKRAPVKPLAPGIVHSEGPVEMCAASSPLKRVIIMLCVALFWNGIVSVFLTTAVGKFQSGHPDWFLTLFLVPFVAVGLFLVGAFVSALLALSNPRVRLWVNPAALAPGRAVNVSWELTGAVRRISKFWIYLEGREEATYRQGSSTATDKSVFARLPIVAISSSWMEMLRGDGTIKIPADAPPTFHASNNKIVWEIKVRGEIGYWPDVTQEYEIPVVQETKS
ncbi:MAG: DUF3592 domain-containing protein [Chthoniobacterales bacterium]